MTDYYPCVVKLGKVEPLPNSDFLQISTVMNEYPVIFRTGDYKSGDLVAFLPYDTIVPSNETFAFLTPPPKKNKDGSIKQESPPVDQIPIKYRTIKSKQVRGTYSEGLLMPCPPGYKEGDSVVEYYGLTKRVYEEEVEDHPNNFKTKSGSNDNEKNPKTFQLKKYDLEGMAKYGYTFEEGENVLIQEKFEGCVDGSTILDSIENGKISIKEIVENRLGIHVKSYNSDSNNVEFNKILEFSELPNNNDWYEIETEDGKTLKLTGNHMVYLPKLGCYRRADELSSNDDVLID